MKQKKQPHAQDPAVKRLSAAAENLLSNLLDSGGYGPDKYDADLAGYNIDSAGDPWYPDVWELDQALLPFRVAEPTLAEKHDQSCAKHVAEFMAAYKPHYIYLRDPAGGTCRTASGRTRFLGAKRGFFVYWTTATQYFFGFSYCSPKDTFNRDRGLFYAIDRRIGVTRHVVDESTIEGSRLVNWRLDSHFSDDVRYQISVLLDMVIGQLHRCANTPKPKES
jgi:hypothetical protein